MTSYPEPPSNKLQFRTNLESAKFIPGYLVKNISAQHKVLNVMLGTNILNQITFPAWFVYYSRLDLLRDVSSW